MANFSFGRKIPTSSKFLDDCLSIKIITNAMSVAHLLVVDCVVFNPFEECAFVLMLLFLTLLLTYEDSLTHNATVIERSPWQVDRKTNWNWMWELLAGFYKM